MLYTFNPLIDNLITFIMLLRLPHLLPTILSIIPTTLAQSYLFTAELNSPPCLIPAEARNIASRWFQIFQTDANGTGTGAALVESTLSPNFTYFDEGASFGDPAAVYNSSQEVYDSVSGTGYSGNLVTDVQYTVLQSLVGCDFVVSRWQSNSRAANATNV